MKKMKLSKMKRLMGQTPMAVAIVRGDKKIAELLINRK